MIGEVNQATKSLAYRKINKRKRKNKSSFQGALVILKFRMIVLRFRMIILNFKMIILNHETNFRTIRADFEMLIKYTFLSEKGEK